MTNLSSEMKKKLDSVGFCFPDYEQSPNLGMVYFYQEDEYVIGGFCNNEYSKMDQEVINNGEWLPDSHQLLQWLQQCDFDVSIQWKSQECRFYISVTNSKYGEYEVRSVDLVNGLGNVIYKICKSAQGKCMPERLLRLIIQPDNASGP